jgi:hypothetical protein
VFVVCGVAIALLGAGEAGHRTGFGDRPDEAELGDVALAETSICTGGTAGGAIETLLDERRSKSRSKSLGCGCKLMIS